MSRPTQTIDRERLAELERSLLRRRRGAASGERATAAPGPAARHRGRDADDDTETVFAVMGGAERSGRWEPPGRVHAFALMGGVDARVRSLGRRKRRLLGR